MQSHPAIRAEVEETRWSHFGRTDLVANKFDPFQKTFFIDGTAGASMFRLEGDLKNPYNPALELLKRNFSGYFALSMIPDDEKQKVLIIGPGGGRDVLVAKMAGSGEITGVEINGDMVAMARAHADYNGGIYSGMPGVKVVISEGRSYLKREGAQYDVIYLSIPITNTSRSPEGFALSESFLFTTDAIKDYLAHLTPNGRLIVVAHDPLELFKLLVMVLDAWEKEGVRLQEALKRIYTTGSPHFPVLVVKRSPIGQEEAQRIHDEIMNIRHYPSATTYIPGITQHAHRIPIDPDRIMEQGMMNEVILSMAEGKFVPEDVIEAVPFNMRPATDESPFFFKIEKGVPNILITLLVLSLIFSVWAFLSRIRDSYPVTISVGPDHTHAPFSRAVRFRILFASLGMGFMLVEIPLIQKFSLFLGEPTYSLSITVLSLLVGGGLGSMVSERLQHLEDRYTIGGPALLVALGVGAALGWSEMIFEWLLGERIVVRAAASAAMLIPLGFVMGIPFPSGIRLLSKTGMSTQIPLMWGINGAMSVTGSVGSMILAIQWGFTVALITGASLYLVVFLLFGTPTSWRRPTVMAS
ncbi:MAG: hypothetical protein GTO13_01740 [Proteobacteria bacterium]|nr:hypothetical protein [Pseudomonadota bacterium]